jgi:PAS domain S-box-containing protein
MIQLYFKELGAKVLRVWDLSLYSFNMAIETKSKQDVLRERFFCEAIDIFAIANMHGAVIDLNDAMLDTFGYSKEELVGMDWSEFVHDADKESSGREFKDIIEKGRSTAFINRIRCKDGSFKMIEWNSVFSPKERVIFIFGRDISNSRRALDNLNSQVSLQRAIIESADFAIISTNADGIVQTYNQRARRMFGHANEEVVGKLTPLVFFDPTEIKNYAEDIKSGLDEDVDDGMTVLLAKARAGLFDERTWMLKRKSGIVFPAHVSVSALRDENTQIYGYLFVARDITEQRRVENLKNEFISTVSHELRTPMTSIRASLGIIASGMSGELPAESKPLIDIAIDSSDRLIRLINDILDVEKIESGRVAFNLKEVEVEPLIKQGLLSNKAFAAKHNVRFEFKDSVPNVKIKVDVDRFAQILDNLLSNAAKYTKEGDSIEVKMSRNAGKLRVAVVDHGQGIPDSFKPKVFAKFMQANSSDRREKGGTGLGLAICKSLVERQGGTLGFDSEEGKGSTFYFEFPVLEERSESGHTI